MREKVRILVIEDKEQLAKDAQREIVDFFEDHAEISVEVAFVTDFDAGLALVRAGESDVVVLDVRRDSSEPSDADEFAGKMVYHDFQEARFAPVVFWTALPETVKDKEMVPLVTVVTKDDIEKLPPAIEAAIGSRAVATIAGIEGHIASVLRRHMWSELAPNWAEYTSDGEAVEIAPVLLTRLARVIEDDREANLTAHPSHRYVYPPTSEVRSPGDILRASDGGWWVTLTPACDFAQGKVGLALLCRANPLEEHEKYQKWSASNLGTNAEADLWNSLRRNVLMATSGRYHYLPAFRAIPNLVIDLENVRSLTMDEFDMLAPVAALASPFTEALLVQHSHYRGRIGIPDLNSGLIKERLVASRAAAEG